MNLLVDAHNSKIAGVLANSSEVLHASSLGDQRFIGFLLLQAALPQRAPLVIASLEAEVAKGFVLDGILKGILLRAKSTVRLFPQARRAH
jgi:hypothetical protein